MERTAIINLMLGLTLAFCRLSASDCLTGCNPAWPPAVVIEAGRTGVLELDDPVLRDLV
jgi:hypothetical protein